MSIKKFINPSIVKILVLCLTLTSAAAREKKGHKQLSEKELQCRQAKHPIFIVPGIMGSDLDVRVMSSPRSRAPCSMRRPTKLSLWPPFSPDLLRNSACFMYLLQPVPCDTTHHSQRGRLHRPKLCNNAGVSMFVNPGGEAGTDTFAFQQGGYTQLTDFLTRHFGYQLGKDLFAAPYDWRLTLPALEDSGQFDFIAKRVEAAVQKNCGKKAILIGHSMGTLVSLGLMQSPHFARWRDDNIKGYIALAPPYGGSTYAIATKLGGAKISLIDFIGDILQPMINELVYHGSRGLPSMLMLMPNRHLWGKDFVLVHTPVHNYTLGELTKLFQAIGDFQAAEMYEHSQILGNLISKGPVPGVETYCIYGAAEKTVQSWRYKSIIQGKPAPVGSADAAKTGMGDGVVNVESMRLCNKLTNNRNIHELGPGVDHSTVLSHPQALSAVKAVLTQMLGLNQQQQQEDGDAPGGSDSAAGDQDKDDGTKHKIVIGGRATEFVSESSDITLPGNIPVNRQIEG